MRKILSKIVSAVLGLQISLIFIPEIVIRTYPDSNFFGFSLTAQWHILLVLGIILGLLNYFLKPVLKILALPLEIVTLGLFTIVINMGLLWMLDKMFDELYIPLWLPILYTTLIIWALNIIIDFFLIKNKD